MLHYRPILLASDGHPGKRSQPIIQSTCYPKGCYRLLIAVTQLYGSVSYNNPVKRPPKGSFIGPWLVLQLYHNYIYYSVSRSASLLVNRLSKASLSRNTSKKPRVGIDSYKLFLLSPRGTIIKH